MGIRVFDSLREAIEGITEESKYYVFLRHILDAGKEVKLHYHPKANEFLIVENGVFNVVLDEGLGDKTFIASEGRVVVIRFRPGQAHGLRSLGVSQLPLSYFVLRDVADATIYGPRAEG